MLLSSHLILKQKQLKLLPSNTSLPTPHRVFRTRAIQQLHVRNCHSNSTGRRQSFRFSVAPNWHDRKRMGQAAEHRVAELPAPSCLPARTHVRMRRSFHPCLRNSYSCPKSHRRYPREWTNDGSDCIYVRMYTNLYVGKSSAWGAKRRSPRQSAVLGVGRMQAFFTTPWAWNLPFRAIVTTGFGKTCTLERGV